MGVRPLPLTILAGSDPRPGDMPAGVEAAHPLRGLKGRDLLLDGRPLIDHAVERFVASGWFDPVFVAGPLAVYGERRGAATVIDADGSFGDNIETAVSHVAASHSGPQAITTCDILPVAAELDRLMGAYAARAPVDFWLPVAVVPERSERLGASRWKPRYRIRRTVAAAEETLPAHLVIADPAAVDLGLVYRSFELAYRSRNHPVLARLWTISSGILAWLVGRDLRAMKRGRLPFGTVRTLTQATLLAIRLRSGSIRSDELAHRLDRIFVDAGRRRRYPGRRGAVDLVDDVLSFAKDIDTEEEAEEAARAPRFRESSPS